MGEHVGDVCIRLSEEAIVANLWQQKFMPRMIGSTVMDELCCICLVRAILFLFLPGVAIIYNTIIECLPQSL